ncbi:phosphotransferase [Streptomyces sp. NPDC046203]|uniref:phosphotransferase family protein n=1 Tax=Streptomyces sp. NPDC046203 TaxID=3154602 RepID=UPI00340C8CA2
MDDTAPGTPVLQELHALARAAAHPEGAKACPCPVALLADRDDGTVVRHGPLVLKAHAPRTAAEPGDRSGGRPREGVGDGGGEGAAGGDLDARIAVAALPALAGVLLPPLPGAALPDVPLPGTCPPDASSLPRARTAVLGDRPLTLWPYGIPVDPDAPEAAPWEAAARLLALLHRTPAPPGLPAMRAPLKAALAVDRMRRAAPGHPATATVLRAWRTLPEEYPASAADRLCHGDFHLGQLVRAPHWRLIDVDDLGLGDPAWDLARPAAWFAAGLLAPEVWARFLGAYEAAGGPATGWPGSGGSDGESGGDPWARLDIPARALTVQTAALALAKSTAEGRPLDEVENVMIDTCARIVAL